MQDNSLQSKIERMWERTSSHFFVSDFSKLTSQYNKQDIHLAMATQTARSCYQSTYKNTVPHCLMGLETAAQLNYFIYSKSSLLPLTQMGWYALAEGVSEPVDIKKLLGPPPIAENLNLETLKKEYKKRNFKAIFSLVVFLMRNERDRKKVFSFLISETLHDELNVGHKIIYLVKTWHFCELMGWEKYESLWFPVLHYLIQAKPHVETYPVVEVFYNQNWKKLLKAIHTDDVVFEAEQFQSFRDSLFNDERQTTLELLSGHIEKGQSLNSLFEALKLSASDLLYLGSFQRWVTTIHALTYTEVLSSISHLLEPQDQLKALLMSALFIKKMAILSKPFDEPTKAPLEKLEQRNCPEYFLEHAIKTGDISKALGAMEYLVQSKSVTKPVLELLAFTAAKNDHNVLSAHDLKYAWAALWSYQNSSHPLKAKYLMALVKLLAQQTKNPTVYHALCNTQKIRQGFFSVGGDFQF